MHTERNCDICAGVAFAYVACMNSGGASLVRIEGLCDESSFTLRKKSHSIGPGPFVYISESESERARMREKVCVPANGAADDVPYLHIFSVC